MRGLLGLVALTLTLTLASAGMGGGAFGLATWLLSPTQPEGCEPAQETP